MQGSLQPLVGMFTGGDTCLVIPVYQRNYDWTKENCARLFDDLVDTIRENRATHFFGAIVYKDEGQIGESTVIDGQQRLTTVNLLFLALYRGLSDGRLQSTDPRLPSRIFQEYLQSEFATSGHKLKLKTVKKDAEAYRKLFGEESYFDDNSNLTANYGYFSQRLAAGELTPEQMFNALRRLQVMKLKLEESDDAQLIFESLNSTGLDLSEADMVRNYVLMGQSREQQERLYEQYWNRIESNVDYDTSPFIRHYLTAKMGRAPKLSQLYEDFRTYLRQNELTVTDILSEMREYSENFFRLRHADMGNPQIDKLLHRYNMVNRDVTLPLLLPVVGDYRAERISAEDLARVIRTVDNYLARRFVCGYPTNSLNKIFELLYRETVKLRGPQDTFSDVLTYQLLRRQGSGTFPTDQEFADALRTKDFYHVSIPQRTYMFECLENGDSNDIRDIANGLTNGDISIEHVMPQTLTPEWEKELGPEYKEIHTTWLHRLGNLTVTGYNSTYSNAPFQQKRDRKEGFRDSPYRLNRVLRDSDGWGVTQLEQRSEHLVRAALAYWRTPVTSYEPRPDARDVEAMGSDADFTGRKPRAWEYQGAVHSVATWKQTIIEVLSLLAEQDPAGIHRRASEGGLVRLHPESEPAVNEYSEVAPGIDVYTANSTSTKMWLLRDLFQRLRLDPDELIFHLIPEVGDQTAENRGERPPEAMMQA